MTFSGIHDIIETMSDAITMSVAQGQLMGLGAVIFLIVANAWVLIYDKYWLHPEPKVIEDPEAVIDLV